MFSSPSVRASVLFPPLHLQESVGRGEVQYERELKEFSLFSPLGKRFPLSAVSMEKSLFGFHFFRGKNKMFIVGGRGDGTFQNKRQRKPCITLLFLTN